jgi:hypothetical protein
MRRLDNIDHENEMLQNMHLEGIEVLTPVVMKSFIFRCKSSDVSKEPALLGTSSMLVSCLASSLTLKLEAKCFSEI